MEAGELANIPPQTVQLRHDLPDGSTHVDWMLDLDPTRRARLTTFRLDRRVDRLAPGRSMPAERIADHRRRYFSYEGPLDGDRGRVERLARGWIDAVQNVGDTWAFLVRWHDEDDPGDGPPRLVLQHLRVRRGGGPGWVVDACPAPSGTTVDVVDSRHRRPGKERP